MIEKSKSHIVFITYYAMGHMRPECALAVSLVRKFPLLTITLIVFVDFALRAEAELHRQCPDEDHAWMSRIRVVGVGRTVGRPVTLADTRNRMLVSENMVDQFPAIFALIAKDAEYDDDKGVSWPSLGRRPSLIIGDVVMGDVLLPIREQYDIPLFIWWFGTGGTFTRFFAPLALGGQMDYEDEVNATFNDPAARNGRSHDDVAREVWTQSTRLSDNVIRIRGVPLHYQWEYTPQDLWRPISYRLYTTSQRLVRGADGVLLTTLVDLETEGYEGVKDFYGADGKRPVLALGPHLPVEYFTAEPADIRTVARFARSEVYNSQAQAAVERQEHSTNGKSLRAKDLTDPCIAFLDNALHHHGAQSALYISFGSVIFPFVPRHIEILLEVLLALHPPMPFILSTAAAQTPLPAGLSERIEKSGKGLIVAWAPQQAIMTHPAIGWLLTHCGANAIFESLSQGIPMIAWPFFADQPTHAVWISEGIDVAFELLQIRTGPGAQRAYRGGQDGTEIVGTEEAVRAEMEDVFRRCRGEEGRRKRGNAEKARAIILKAVQRGGQVDEHLEKLATYM